MKTPPLPPPARDVDPDAPASEEELRAAEELRDALVDASRPHEGASLARAVVLAHSPRPLESAENEAIVQRALGAAETRRGSLRLVPRRPRRSTFVMVATTLALAAGVLLFQWSAQRVAPVDPSVVAYARSSQPLFREPFAVHGGKSARIDRIASARAADLRENMFARWDVR